MNNFMYPLTNNYHQIIIEELRKMNETLKKIEYNTQNNTKKKENTYLEKDDNYYMI